MCKNRPQNFKYFKNGPQNFKGLKTELKTLNV